MATRARPRQRQAACWRSGCSRRRARLLQSDRSRARGRAANWAASPARILSACGGELQPRAVRTFSTVAAVMPAGSTVVPRMRCTSRAQRTGFASPCALQTQARAHPPDRLQYAAARQENAAYQDSKQSARVEVGAALKAMAGIGVQAVAPRCARTAMGSNHAASTSTFFVSA
jgi:hypothetical protein